MRTLIFSSLREADVLAIHQTKDFVKFLSLVLVLYLGMLHLHVPQDAHTSHLGTHDFYSSS